MKSIAKYLHHLFIPKEANNYRARAIHLDFLTLYLVFALLFTFLSKNIAFSSNNVLGIATDITIDKLYNLTNKEREKFNLSPLMYNEKLGKAAEAKARDMFKKDYWAHYGPSSETPWDFMLSQNYKYEYAGENLAKNFLFSDNVVDAWMKSESHRENILRREYQEIGFAVVNGVLNGEETTLVIQMFGTPLKGSLVQKTPNNNLAPKQLNAPVKTAINQKSSKASILAKQDQRTFLNLLPLSFNLNIFFVFLLILALILDFYFVVKMHIFRISGKNIAHIIFLSFILLGILFITKGAII